MAAACCRVDRRPPFLVRAVDATDRRISRRQQADHLLRRINRKPLLKSSSKQRKKIRKNNLKGIDTGLGRQTSAWPKEAATWRRERQSSFRRDRALCRSSPERDRKACESPASAALKSSSAFGESTSISIASLHLEPLRTLYTHLHHVKSILGYGSDSNETRILKIHRHPRFLKASGLREAIVLQSRFYSWKWLPNNFWWISENPRPPSILQSSWIGSRPN